MSVHWHKCHSKLATDLLQRSCLNNCETLVLKKDFKSLSMYGIMNACKHAHKMAHIIDLYLDMPEPIKHLRCVLLVILDGSLFCILGDFVSAMTLSGSC